MHSKINLQERGTRASSSLTEWVKENRHMSILSAVRIPRGLAHATSALGAVLLAGCATAAPLPPPAGHPANPNAAAAPPPPASTLLELPAGEPVQPVDLGMGGMDHGDMEGMNMSDMQHEDSTGMAGMDHSRMEGVQEPSGAMRGMDHTGMNMRRDGSMNIGAMMEMHARMMADPVIRERIAADPVLRRMMEEMMSPGQSMPGMEEHSMEGMGAPGEADVRQAMEFMVRLLSDPRIQARIHADPQLHGLWSDPEVQRRLDMMRESISP